MSYEGWKITAGVIATIGLYSVLFRENKFYRFFEHIFLGLAAGFSLVVIWTEILEDFWWNPMVGDLNAEGIATQPARWLYAILVPIALMGYFVFSKRHNWMSRIPIGILLGFWSGQQVQIWWNRWGPQIYSSMQTIVPTETSTFRVPQEAVAGAVYPAQAISNFVFLVAILSALSYFFFSFEMKNKALASINSLGRWVLMVGFGAIFGATVMARFALVIDRMHFIWIEWLNDIIIQGVIRGGGG